MCNGLYWVCTHSGNMDDENMNVFVIFCNLQATTENSSLSALLDFILNLKKKKLNLSLYLSLLPLLACTYLNND